MASKKEFEAYKKEQKQLLDSKKITYNQYMDRITKFMKGENASTNNYKTQEQQNRMEKIPDRDRKIEKILIKIQRKLDNV